MEVSITETDTLLPTRFIHSLSMTIRSFRGRRGVEVHLFKNAWPSEQESAQDWQALIAPSGNLSPADDPSRFVIMESFTTGERDRIVSYLKEQYSTRLTAINSVQISFPVPSGLVGFSHLEIGGNTGFIDFSTIPSYPLDIPLKGFFDLSLHPAIAD